MWHESQVFLSPNDVTLRTGALLEPASIAARILDKAWL